MWRGGRMLGWRWGGGALTWFCYHCQIIIWSHSCLSFCFVLVTATSGWNVIVWKGSALWVALCAAYLTKVYRLIYEHIWAIKIGLIPISGCIIQLISLLLITIHPFWLASLSEIVWVSHTWKENCFQYCHLCAWRYTDTEMKWDSLQIHSI